MRRLSSGLGFMSKAPDKAVHVLAETPRLVREDVQPSAKMPEPAELQASSPAESPFDISAPLARIEGTGQFIETCLQRIRELETLVEQSENKQAETAAQLRDATQRNVEVEQALAVVRQQIMAGKAWVDMRRPENRKRV